MAFCEHKGIAWNVHATLMVRSRAFDLGWLPFRGKILLDGTQQFHFLFGAPAEHARGISANHRAR